MGSKRKEKLNMNNASKRSRDQMNKDQKASIRRKKKKQKLHNKCYNKNNKKKEG